MSNLVQEFSQELDYFEEDVFVEFAMQALPLFPTYFATAPASLSGKYHPEGITLVQHTKAVMYLCNEIAKSLNLMGDLRECFILAGLLHDSFKFKSDDNGNEIETDPLHPLRPREKFKCISDIIGAQNYDLVMDLVESHSGIWSPSPRLMPDENELLNWAFHFCDYIASRREVSVDMSTTHHL